ncbi:MAG: hypothetical protein HY822_24535 [Acidobacteria bacterium]|nr:hypothetical protein [Acidobacteriota bacterium]
MKRFEFPLERVLKWRRARLDAELAALGGLRTEAQAIDERRSAIDSERAAAERALAGAAILEARQLEALDGFRAWSQRESRRLSGQRAECERRIDAQRQRVAEARRGFRLLERLRQVRQAEWSAQLDRELENLAGELHLARIARLQRSSP